MGQTDSFIMHESAKTTWATANRGKDGVKARCGKALARVRVPVSRFALCFSILNMQPVIVEIVFGRAIVSIIYCKQ